MVLAWRDYLSDPATLSAVFDHLTQASSESSPATLRIESPGEDFDVERLLLSWGASEPSPETPFCQRISSVDALQLELDRGRLAYLRQWYLGFRKALQLAAHTIVERADTRLSVMNGIHEILVMFDKAQTHQALGRAGVPKAPILETVLTVDELIAQMRLHDWTRVFVKPWHGSSASGVVALRWDAHSIAAKTSVELERAGSGSQLQHRLYNSLRIRRYTDESDVRAILSCILADGAVVEQWLPKATIQEQNFDLRVLTIAGKAMHTVVRVGKSPMTNLHLGNARGDLERVYQRLGPERVARVRALCEDVARVFSGCHYVGVDVMVSHDLRREYVLEANAFGDLLPNVLIDGQDTYESELALYR